MIQPFTVRVEGEPKGQPRAKAFARKMGTAYVARVYTPGTAEAWKTQIALAVRPFLQAVPYDEAIIMDCYFLMPRPKGHFRTGKNAGVLRDDAPSWFTGKPDRDNLEKAVMDALTTLGLYRDDALVCYGRIAKLYAPVGERPGVILRFRAATETLADSVLQAILATEERTVTAV